MRFYGQWNPPVDEVLLRNYFESKTQGICVECGAADGVSDSCCKIFEEMGWKGVNIEANPINYGRLIKYRPSSINIHAVLSEQDGKALFRNDTVLRLLKDGEEFPYTQTISYKTLLDKIGNQGIDLFALDVEGHEPLVLKGMIDSGLPLPKVFCIEYPYCTIDTVLSILGSKYRVDGISFNNIFLSLPDVKVRTPFWGRTEKVRMENNSWVFPSKAEF